MAAFAPAPKPYLHREGLAALTPWSVEAIDTMVKRGMLRAGVHYFQLQRRGRLIFKWAAIVALIERGAGDPTSAGSQHGNENGKVIDVEEATERLRRLHG
jgi:hypothetical protein